MLEEFTDKQAQWEERSKDGKWYVVHIYSGHENKVKANIEKMVENRGYIDDIFQVLVWFGVMNSTFGAVTWPTCAPAWTQ